MARCVAQGAKRIVVLPYFLAGGNHVNKDIPAVIAQCRTEFAQVSIEVAAYLGASESMAQLVLECSRQID